MNSSFSFQVNLNWTFGKWTELNYNFLSELELNLYFLLNEMKNFFFLSNRTKLKVVSNEFELNFFEKWIEPNYCFFFKVNSNSNLLIWIKWTKLFFKWLNLISDCLKQPWTELFCERTWVNNNFFFKWTWTWTELFLNEMN